MEHLEQQPSKKIATDGPVNVVQTNSSSSHRDGKATAPATLSDSNVGPSTSSEQMPNDSESGHRVGRDKGDSQAIKMSAILSQAWKDDLNSGHLLVLLFELFGEGILSFIPAPEMSLFL